MVLFFKATRVLQTSLAYVYGSDPCLWLAQGVLRGRRGVSISYQDVLGKDLRFMDAAAIALCREGSIPIVLFDMVKNSTATDNNTGSTIATGLVMPMMAVTSEPRPSWKSTVARPMK